MLLSASCGQRPGGSRIVGGQTATPNSWPWQLSLRMNNVHIWGASLINNMWAVTPAHCVDRISDPNKYSLMAGKLTILITISIMFFTDEMHSLSSSVSLKEAVCEALTLFKT